jgi:PEP-CTERM motif
MNGTNMIGGSILAPNPGPTWHLLAGSDDRRRATWSQVRLSGAWWRACGAGRAAGLDRLSIWTSYGNFVGSGNSLNVVGPFLDGGTLNAIFRGSNWTIPGGSGGANDITVVGNVGKSLITLGGLNLAITTTVGVGLGGNGVTEAFHFTNNTGSAIQDILFDDYYNFHANGSLNTTQTACPTTTFNSGTGTAITIGSNAGGCAAIVSDGFMFGSAAPFTWDLGLAGDVLAAMTAANGGNYSGFNKALGPVTGDGAVDVVWDLGALAVGASTDFTITKNFNQPPPSTPEPASLALLGTGLLGLALVRRRRNRV